MEAKYGENNIGLADTYKLRGEIELKNKNFSAAEKWAEKALKLIENHFQADSLIYQAIVTLLVEVYEASNEIEKSIDLLYKLEKALSLNIGADHSAIGDIKYRIASQYFQKGDFEAAENKAMETVGFAEKNGQHNEIYAIYTNELIEKIRKLESNRIESEKQKKEFDLVLEEKQNQIMQEMERNDEAFKTEMENFNKNLQADKYNDALQNIKNGIQINNDINNINLQAINVASINLNMGKMLYYNEKYNEALKGFTTALETFKEKKSLPEISDCLTHIADSYYFLEDFEKAISNRLQLLSISENLSEKDEKQLAQIYYDLALDYYRNNEDSQSVFYAKKALELRNQLFGKDSEEADEARFLLGRAYYYDNYFNEARECLRTSFLFRNNHYGENSVEVQVVKEWMKESGFD